MVCTLYVAGSMHQTDGVYTGSMHQTDGVYTVRRVCVALPQSSKVDGRCLEGV